MTTSMKRGTAILSRRSWSPAWSVSPSNMHSGLAASKEKPSTAMKPMAVLVVGGHTSCSLPSRLIVCKWPMKIEAVEVICVNWSG